MENYYDELASVSSNSQYSNVIDDQDLELLMGLIEDLDDFDVGDYDEVVSDFNSKDIKTFSDLDIALVFKTVKNNTPYYNKLICNSPKIKGGTRLYRMLSDEKFISEKGTLICKNGVALFSANGIETLIGSSKITCELKIDGENLFELADAYVEEVKGKGSGFGFSMHCHLLATISLRSNPGYLEPLEGCDYTVKGNCIDNPITIEVTGMNYKQRKTSANITLNKYLLLQCCTKCEKVNRTIKYSNYEETGVTDFLKNSNHYQGDSEYTPSFDKMHGFLEKMKDSQFEGIHKHVKKWLNNDIKLTEPETEDEIDFEIHGSKGELFPAPFRLKAMNHDDRLESIKPEASLWRDNSGTDWYAGKNRSFHT